MAGRLLKVRRVHQGTILITPIHELPGSSTRSLLTVITAVSHRTVAPLPAVPFTTRHRLAPVIRRLVFQRHTWDNTFLWTCALAGFTRWTRISSIPPAHLGGARSLHSPAAFMERRLT